MAVLEEMSELDAGPSKGPGRQRLKTRALAQVVSPGASTYLYDCCLRPDDVEFKVRGVVVSCMNASINQSINPFIHPPTHPPTNQSPAHPPPSQPIIHTQATFQLLWLLLQENHPYVGLLRVPSGGFTLVEAYLDAKTLKVRRKKGGNERNKTPIYGCF